MAVIHVLDKHTAELIAAGEVVERPASVVKELLENAIDAGAAQITVSIESGGVKLIEISDNGTGIEAAYIPTAFIRHATSKIQTEEDLNHIHTLGFRGEALASIASVARVEVLTRTEADECASVYRIEGGEAYPIEPGARSVGTTIRVKDLFYNTPARMKFLKKDSSEGTFVADTVAHVALSHPEVSFKFIREGKLQYVTPGDGQLRSAAYAVLGREFSRDLIELDNGCSLGSPDPGRQPAQPEAAGRGDRPCRTGCAAFPSSIQRGPARHRARCRRPARSTGPHGSMGPDPAAQNGRTGTRCGRTCRNRRDIGLRRDARTDGL